MKSVKNMLLLVLLVVAIAWAIEFTQVNQPMQGNCGVGFISKDETSPFEYNGEQNVCKVIVKAGSQNQEDACYGFTYPPANQTDGCYNVIGLGSISVSVGGGDTSPECRGISHVEFYPCSDTTTATSTTTRTPLGTQTATSTATATEIPANTPTVTSTGTRYTITPSATVTSTLETATSTGSVTPDVPTDTPGPTPLGTPTPTLPSITETSTGTVPPGTPDRTSTGTVLVRLPDTGADGEGGLDAGAWYIPVGFLVALVVLILKRGRDEAN